MGWDWESDSDDQSSEGQLLPQISFLEQFQDLKFQAIKRHALKQAKQLSEDPVRPRCRICTLPVHSCPRRGEHEELARQKDEAEEEEARRAAEEAAYENAGGNGASPRSRSPQLAAGARNQGGPRRIRSPGGGEKGRKDFRAAGRRYRGEAADGADDDPDELEKQQKLDEYKAQKQQAQAELEQANRAEALSRQHAAKAKEERRKARGAALKEMLVKQTDGKAQREEEQAAEAHARLAEDRKKEDRRKKQNERQRAHVEEWRAKKAQWDRSGDGSAPADTDAALVSARHSMAATS